MFERGTLLTFRSTFYSPISGRAQILSLSLSLSLDLNRLFFFIVLKNAVSSEEIISTSSSKLFVSRNRFARSILVPQEKRDCRHVLNSVALVRWKNKILGTEI